MDLRSVAVLALASAACHSTPEARPSGARSPRALTPIAVARAAPPAEPGSPQPEGLDPDADLAEVLAFARRHNPGLEAAVQRWNAALEREAQVGALPPPRLTLAGYLEEVETRTGPMEGRVGLTQALPWFGERGLAGDVARERAEAERARVERVRLALEHDVRDAWYESAWLAEAVAVTEAHRELLGHWESVARARLETGVGPHSDVIRAQVELGQLENRRQGLVDLRRPVAARLNAALDRPSDAPLPRASLPSGEPATPDEARLRESVRERNPELLALTHEVESARRAVDLARKAYRPDFVVGVEYTFVGEARSPGVPGSGDDPVALTLGLDLPLQRGAYAAGVRETEARVRAGLAELDQSANRLSAELEMALYRFRDADRRVDLFRDTLIPKGEESVRAVDIAYQAGDESFLGVIDAERLLLEFRLEAVRAAADRVRALAEIEHLASAPPQEL